MSTWKSQMRSAEAYRRQLDREAVKQQRELERREKERAKLDAVEQARLEVDAFENRIAVLLSVHKDCAKPWDWPASAAALPPPLPVKGARYELRAKQAMALLRPSERHGWEEKIEIARSQDEETFQAALVAHANNHREWETAVTLARKLCRGDASAYEQAIHELSPLTEIAHFGSSTEFTVHNPRLLECMLILNSSKAIPAENKSLTSSNKVSVKPMPVARFHELYQDYVCSCMLRVARELFALLPIQVLLLTARTEIFDSSTGKTSEQPVLSAAITRERLVGLAFERLDPSDTIESFPHRGDFKASRKTGAFAPITPLTASDIMPATAESLGIAEMLKQADSLRRELAIALSAIGGGTHISTP